MFSAPGLRTYRGTNATEFTSANNAWCVSLDIKPRDKARFPFYFTRNLTITNLSEATGPLSECAPFGRQGNVVIWSDGAGQILKEPELRDSFNPQNGKNKVLRP
jgi:hypothetical protein